MLDLRGLNGNFECCIGIGCTIEALLVIPPNRMKFISPSVQRWLGIQSALYPTYFSLKPRL